MRYRIAQTLSCCCFSLVLLSPQGWAENRPCSSVTKDAAEWPSDSPIHDLTLIKAMDPKVKREIGGAGRYREVPRGVLKQIERAQLDFFARECRDNPGLDSYNASQRALEKTREAAIDYLKNRR